MTDVDRLNALLQETRTVKKVIDQIEKQLAAMLTESGGEVYTEYADSEAEKPDLEDIASGESERQRHAKVVLDILRELEREEGAASFDKIVKRAADAAIRQDTVYREIGRLLNEGAIYEPVQGSGKYRLNR